MSNGCGKNKDNQTKGENLPALPATCRNLRHRRQKTKRPAVQAQHTNRRTCSVSAQKLCTAKLVQPEAETTQGRERIRQCMFAVALQTQYKTFSHTCMTCLQIDSVSHWTLYIIVLHGTRFSAQRQLMSYLTRESIFCGMMGIKKKRSR